MSTTAYLIDVAIRCLCLFLVGTVLAVAFKAMRRKGPCPAKHRNGMPCIHARRHEGLHAGEDANGVMHLWAGRRWHQ